MKDVLNEIVAWKKIEVENQKQKLPPSVLHRNVEKIMAEGFTAHSMSNALAESPYGIISEFKRKSPSKGWIHPNIMPADVVPYYEQNGASALSILTDNKYFGGCHDFIRDIRPRVNAPILMKDFVIDEYQVFKAREIGADTILLIAADLKKSECRQLTDMAHELKLEVLLEIHSESELEYADLDVDMIGVNNRNLGSFHTDVNNSFHLASLLPHDKVRVSESGISNPATIRQLREAGYCGFLIGETFMKENDPGLALKNFISEI